MTEQQSFYDQLWELLETELGDTVLCDQMADRIYDLVKENYEVLQATHFKPLPKLPTVSLQGRFFIV